MGRFFGWVGPVAYLLAVGLAVLCGLALVAGPNIDYGVVAYSQGAPVYGVTYSAGPLYELGTLLAFSPYTGGLLAAFWLAALLWFIFQAGTIRTDAAEDERWTAHMLTVAFVGRLVLAPLGVFLTLAAGSLVWSYLALPGPAANLDMLTMALWIELLAAVVTLPFTVYQLCGVARLGNRGLMNATGMVWHTILAFMPVVGFIAMCGLFVNGRACVQAAHDARVARAAIAAAQRAREDVPATTPGGCAGTEPAGETAGEEKVAAPETSGERANGPAAADDASETAGTRPDEPVAQRNETTAAAAALLPAAAAGGTGAAPADISE